VCPASGHRSCPANELFVAQRHHRVGLDGFDFDSRLRTNLAGRMMRPDPKRSSTMSRSMSEVAAISPQRSRGGAPVEGTSTASPTRGALAVRSRVRRLHISPCKRTMFGLRPAMTAVMRWGVSQTLAAGWAQWRMSPSLAA
jgi:hypothetical protein